MDAVTLVPFTPKIILRNDTGGMKNVRQEKENIAAFNNGNARSYLVFTIKISAYAWHCFGV